MNTHNRRASAHFPLPLVFLASLLCLAGLLVGLLEGPLLGAEPEDVTPAWCERTTEWNGYRQFHFTIAGRKAYLVAPKVAPAAGHPWVWRARFPSYHAEMDLLLLAQGYHVGYVDVAGMFGSPDAVEIGNQFYQFVTTRAQLSKRPALEGVSRGGLFVYNWAAANPTKVACIYCDTPVCDFKSWPGGRGMGLGSAAAWKECLQAYGLNESSAITYRGNPVDRAEAIAKAGIPLLHIVAENDRVVPPAENTYLLRTRLEKLGHRLAVMSVAEGTEKSNGHHFTHPAPRQVVRFIVRHTATAPLAPQQLLDNASRILFLGDSITMGGRYVADFDAWLTATRGAGAPLVINAGLSSETVSGLSEEGHAGGRFPRPVLRERLQRVLEVAKPDLVFACYGINCGIYQPFDEERFAAYQTGIRELKAAVEQRGGKLVVITPPFYDDLRRPLEGFSYNQVLKRYSQWLLEQAERDPAGWHVVDLHSAMSAEVDRQRNVSPEFYFQRDGVHPTAEGHWFMARQLFRWAGDSTAADAKTPQQWLDARQLPAEFVELANRRMTIRRDAYVSAAGHKRPGIRTGMPIDQAERAASEITRKLFELVP